MYIYTYIHHIHTYIYTYYETLVKDCKEKILTEEGSSRNIFKKRFFFD